jgi:hypothetical protein
MEAREVSIVVDDGGRSQALSISGTSAQSAAINSSYALVTLSTPGFVRQGSNPSATNDGTDIYLLANVTYRLNVAQGNKIALRTSGAAGTAYITPGA